MKWQEEQKLQRSVLDRYDFIPYFKKCGGINELWFTFFTDHDNDEDLPPEMQHHVFNFLSYAEFVEYLSQRYAGQYDFIETFDYLIIPSISRR